MEPDWESRVSQCCGAENNNTDNDICPDCHEHTGFEYLDAEGNVLFED